jgi:hypothetical protein
MKRITKSKAVKASSKTGNAVTTTTTHDIDPYHRLEIVEVFIRLRELSNQRLQVYSLIVTAYFFVLGLAINNQKLGLFIITIFLILALLIVDNRIKRIEGAVELRALELENRYAPDPDTALLHMSISVAHHNEGWVEKLASIYEIKDPDKREAALRRTRRGLANSLLLPFLIVVEIVVALGLWALGWKLF